MNKRIFAKMAWLIRRAVIPSLLLFLFTSSGVLGYQPIESQAPPNAGGGDPVAPQAVQDAQAVYRFPLSVGVECRDYAGSSGYLPNSLSNCNGVYNTLRSSPWFWGGGAFNWQNGNSWESDFKSNQAGGHKDSWVDNVNMVFYEGHGNPGGFTFSGNNDDTWLGYSDVDTRVAGRRGWGSKNLKWLGLLSCSVLADEHQNDWSYTMDGLHLLMGFATTAYDVNGFGTTFAQRVLAGNSIKDAWLIACDQKQPSGVKAKVMAEEWYDLYESIYSQMPDHPQDATYYVTTKWCGSTLPALSVDPQQVTAMPVFLTPPLAFDVAVNKFGNLGTAFGVPTTPTVGLAPLAQGGVWTSTQGTHQLEMDSMNGLFYYIDSGALFSGTLAASKAAILAPMDAKDIADQFLNANNLMPGDANFAQVSPVNLDTVGHGQPSGKAPEVITSTTTDWEVIYSRVLTGTSTGLAPTAPISFSVVGDGAKLKVYVSAAGGAARVSAPGVAGAVVGAQGGWRQTSSVAGLAPQKMTVVQPYDKIEKLWQVLEPQTAYKHVPFDNPTTKTILDYTLGYWEESTGTGQDQLYPAYIITATYQGASPTVTGTTYMPIDPEFMPPFAKIQSTSNLSQTLWPGQVITMSAADASMTLANLGYNASLDFKLGVGTYTYEWYRGDPAVPANRIGVGRDLAYAVTLSGDSWQATPVAQTISLKVKDIGSTHSSRNTSLTTKQVNVMPLVFLPVVIKN